MLEKPSKLHAIIISGLVLGVVAGSPIISTLNKCCCCGFVLLCGMLSLYLYKKDYKDEMPPLESSDALVLGIITGLAGAIIGTVISVISYFILGPVDKQIMIKFLSWAESQEWMPSENISKLDQTIETLQKAIDMGLRFRDVLSDLLFGLILYPIFAMLGGLIGYGIFGKRKPKSPPAMPIQ
jgi:hypothetical protein